VSKPVRRILVVVLVALVAVPAASARPLLGVRGNEARFQSLTGQRPGVGHLMLGWNQGWTWGSRFEALLPQYGPMPMVSLDTRTGWPGPREALTPKGVATGAGDGYLVALNHAIAQWNRPIYVRPFGEMNGHWNAYSAYTAGGRVKDAAHATRWFRKAFARVYVVLHGGPNVQARLARLGLPSVSGELSPNPYPRLRVIWGPQGYGSPNVPGNSAQAYYPGDAYVDVVGDDLYDIRGKAEWAAAERLYKAHPWKPFAFPEWGLWGIDDPAFVRRMAAFVKGHRRVEMISYFDSKSGSIFDLATKPRSRAAYRSLISPLG
jgi:hypothetical protein